MSFSRAWAFGSFGVGVALFACVGDDGTPVVAPPSSSSSSSGTGASSGSASSSGSSTSSSGSSSSSSSGSPSDSGADTGAGSPACQEYCTSFQSACAFSTTSTDSYPGTAACLAVCALMSTDGLEADSIACRKPYLAAATLDCPAAGPWSFDPDTQKICGNNQPCAAICRAMSPKCDGAGASLGDCITLCTGKLLGGNPSSARTCMEHQTLLAYGPAATAGDVAEYCQAFKDCE